MDLQIVVLAALGAILGASLGSFLNVVAERTLEGRSWWGFERSACSCCGNELKAGDLVPILSFLRLRGKCRSCGGLIPRRCLWVEVVGAFLGGVLAWRWGFSWALPLAFMVSFGLFLNSLTDLYSGFIYDAFALVPGIACLVLRLPGGFSALLDGFLGAALSFGFIALIIIVSRGGMGWGDAVLMAGVGAALGWRLSCVGLYLGLMVGGVFALVLLATGRVKRKTAIPLGPFLAFGGVLSLLVGPALLAFWGWAPGWPW